MPFDTAYAVAKARTAAHKRGWRVEWKRLRRDDPSKAGGLMLLDA
jgi:hypothetical protein